MAHKINVTSKNNTVESLPLDEFIKFYFFSTDFNKAFINLLIVLDKKGMLKSEDLKFILRLDEIGKRDCTEITKAEIEKIEIV